MYSKKTYVCPQIDVIVTESAPLMSGSINSYDKDPDETIKGEESLSNDHNSAWEDDED